MTFHIGELVEHETLGLGKVKKLERNNVYVDFSKAEDYFISLDQAPQHLRPYRFLGTNDVVRHNTYGIGIVRKAEPLEVTIEFTLAGEKTLDWEIAERRCVPRSQGGLAEYLFEHRQDAFNLSKDDPKLLVKLALVDLEREARTDDIKRELTLYGFLSDNDWASWWKNVAPSLRKDPIFDTTDSRRQIYRLREEPKTRWDELLDTFNNSEDFTERFRLAKRIHEKYTKKLTLDQIDTLATYFINCIEDSNYTYAEKVQSYLILRKFRPDFEYDVNDLIQPGLDLSNIVHSADAEEIIEMVNQRDGWETILQTGLSSKAPKIRDFCLDALTKAEKWDKIEGSLEKLISKLPQNGDIFLWLVGNYFEQDYPLSLQPHFLMLHVFDLFGHSKYEQKAIDLITNQEHLQLIIAKTEDKTLQEFLEKCFKSNEISVFVKELILSLLEEQQKDELLGYFSTLVGKELKQTELIEMSQQEYDIMVEKFDHHLDVELIEVTKKLASETDTSSDFKALRKRQNLIINRIHHLKQTLKNCRVIETN